MANPVRLLATQALLLGLSVVVLIVPASALFLERYGASSLPYVYLAVAVLGVAVSHGIRLLQSRLSLTAVAATCIGAYTGLVTLSWALLRFLEQDWVSALLVGVNSLAIPVGFVLIGTQVGRLLDVREVKESFARIVAGLSLGYVVGGVGTAALIGPLGGPVDLLPVAAALGAAYLWVTMATGRRFPGELRQPPPRPEQTHVAVDGPRPKRRRGGLIRLIFAYQVMVVAVTQLLDYVVWERAAYHFPDASDLARFQGLFSTLLNLLTLVFVLLAAGPLLVRFGERGGLVANPLGLSVLLVVSTVVALVAGEGAIGFFVAVCAQEVAHIALADGLTRAAMNTAYQALDRPSRLQAQTVAEAAGAPIGLGLVGVMLLLLRLAGFGVGVVVVTTLVLTLVWLGLAVLAHRRYRDGVLALVTARPWEPLDLVGSDDAVVRGLLTSTDPRDVMVALSAVSGRRFLPVSEVAVLLESDDPYARLAAVCELIEAGGESADDAQGWWRAAVEDPDPEVHAAALSGCAAAPDPFYEPFLVALVPHSPPSAALADALERHAAGVAPAAVERLARETDVLTRERLTWALGVMRDGLAAAPAGLPPPSSLIDEHGQRVGRVWAATASLGDEPTCAPLRRALQEDLAHSARALSDHLALHHGRRRVETILAALDAPEGDDDRALAVELLEVLNGREAAERLAVLLDPQTPRTEAARQPPQPVRTAAEWLRELVADPDDVWGDPWLRACAIYAAPVVLGPAAADLVRPWVDDGDAAVAETARWAVAAALPV
ncbi:MAG: hypothetical protein ABJA89_00335 [Lapillicoccus sp.]